jgi:hypothetical protein
VSGFGAAAGAADFLVRVAFFFGLFFAARLAVPFFFGLFLAARLADAFF